MPKQAPMEEDIGSLLALADPTLPDLSKNEEEKKAPAPMAKEEQSIGGFSIPDSLEYGEINDVESVARDVEATNTIDDWYVNNIKKNTGAKAETETYISTLETSVVEHPQVQPMPPTLVDPAPIPDPYFEPQPSPLPQPETIKLPSPEVSINDTTINKKGSAEFTISLQQTFAEDLILNINYSEDITLTGGNGLISFDKDSHVGLIQVPAGANAITLTVQLKDSSPLVPGDTVQISILSAENGITPTLVKPLGTATVLYPSHDISMNVDDIFWTAASTAQKNYNLVFVLDVSISMLASVDKMHHTRLNKAKEALVNFIDYYDKVADNLNITIIPFASGEKNQGAFAYSALDVQDAKDYVLRQGVHEKDGINVLMNNPDTGKPLGRYTQYNDALFHARTILEENITDEKFADYAHKVYFLSDGEPTANHSALDNQEWPEQWDSWQEFIQNPQSTIPNSFAQGIDAFAVSIGNSSKIEQALEPIVLDPKYVFSAQIDLANLGEELLRTVPDYFEANLLHNDIDNNHPRLVNEISFKVEDATQYMLDHNLYGTGAFASVDNTTVIIPVPPVDSYVEFPTPLGATCLLNPHGEIFYLPPKVEEDTFEIFEYYAIDLTNNNVDSAKVYFHVLSNHEKLHYVTGNEPLTNRGLEDVIILEGKEGDHTFIIDLENAKPQTIVIEDLFQNNNVLHFTHTQSVRLEELFTDFTVHGTLGPLEFTLADGPTTLMLNNPGAYVGDNLLEALRFLEQHVQVDIL